MINEIKANQFVTQSQVSNTQTQTKQVNTAATQAEAAKNTDTVQLGTPQRVPGTYTKPSSRKSDAADVEALKAAADQAYENLRALVEKMLSKQNEAAGKASGKSTKTQTVSLEAVDQAKLAISEDGEFGVKAVSDRIVKFAVAISGGDKSKYEELRAAIDKGFQQAGKALGGELPDISKQTYKEVMRKLDEWKDGTETQA